MLELCPCMGLLLTSRGKFQWSHMFPNFSLQVSARFPAPTATGPSPTAPIYGLICRPTLRWRSISVACALAPSAACHCCRNTAPRGAAPLRCETAWREAEGTHSELRRACSHGEEVFTSPVALLRTYKATKSMKWPALWDLDGIKPHYGSDFTSLFFTIKKTADKLIFFFFLNIVQGLEAGPNLNCTMQTLTWYQLLCCYCAHSKHQICSELIGLRGVLSHLCPGAGQLRIMAETQLLRGRGAWVE